MSVKSEQWTRYTIDEHSATPTVDGGQSVLDVGYRHIIEYFAWFVSKSELQNTIDSGIPDPYKLVGEPNISEVVLGAKLYSVQMRGQFVSNSPVSPQFTGAHSGNFY